MVHQQQLRFSTSGRDTYNITDQINEVIEKSGIKIGICQIFIHHTSASLILCENADPTVRTDLEAFMSRLVPDGDRIFKHRNEGDDDMPAHIRTILTESSLSIPVNNGKSIPGVWQGIYLWEHKQDANKRNLTITVMGE
jgi:secondary thiamine-phosphate synthase enzyme